MTKCTGLGQGACEGDPTCCTWASTGCGGSNSADCSSCTSPTTCCDWEETACTGSQSYICLGKPQAECEADPASRCCVWGGGPPASCNKRFCPGVAPGNCAYCGCDATGDCSPKACGAVGVGNCTYCGCTLSGTCSNKACSVLASIATCKSCTGCGCCHQITASCTISSDKVFGTVWVRAAAIVTHTGGTVVCSGFGWETGGGWKKANAVAGVPAVQNLGGQCCV